MLGSLWLALVAPFKGLKLIFSDRKLLALSAAPMLIDIALLVALGAVLFFKLDNIVNWLVAKIVSNPGAWLGQALEVVLTIVFGAVVLLLLLLLFVVIGTVLASPFLDAISERTERIVAQSAEEDQGGLKQIVQDIVRSIKGTVKKLLLIAAVQVAILALNIIPVIGNAAYAAASSLASLVFVGWEFLDFPWDRWRWDYKRKKEFVKRRLIHVAAFGLSTSALLLVPVLNIALMPAAATGATIWALAEKEGRDESEENARA